MSRLLMLALFLAVGAPQPAPQFFTNTRDIRVSQPGRQAYFVVDPEVWAHARPDLADLRIYASDQEIGYALATERGSGRTRETPVSIFNLGSVDDAAQFTIDTQGAGEYNRVVLDLDARDFVSRATVDGLDDLNARGLRLGTFTLYDFTREQLGRSVIVKLPDSRFRYLRFTLPGIAPAQVRSATLAFSQETKPIWTDLAVRVSIAQSGRDTVVTWLQPKNVPLDRVALVVRPDDPNYRRGVTLFNADDEPVTRGQVSRVHLQRGGKLVESEANALDIPGARSAVFKLVIDNGDDPPLHLQNVGVLSAERRVYFDPRGQSTLRLYYGDSELGAPTYDYAKLFQQSSDVVLAQLGPGRHNPAYTGRPDARPWTDRHPTVLWLVLLAAVLALGAIAVRSLRASR